MSKYSPLVDIDNYIGVNQHGYYTPFIDNISITSGIPKLRRERLISRFDEVVGNMGFQCKAKRSNNDKDPFHRHIYKRNLIWYLDNDNEKAVYVSIDPKKPKDKTPIRFFRIEFNPANLTPDDLEELRAKLIKLLGRKRTRRLFTKGIVTRIDIAIDIPGITPNDFYVYTTYARISKVFRGDDGKGKVETIYNGSKNSRTFLRTYDKGQQLFSVKNLKHFKGKKVSRFEFVLKPRVRVSELLDIENPFLKITTYSTNFNPLDFTPEFMRLCMDEGFQSAYMKTDRDEIMDFAGNLMRYSIQLFCPYTVWEGYPDALIFIARLKPKKAKS